MQISNCAVRPEKSAVALCILPPILHAMIERKDVWRFPHVRDGGLRGKARFTHPTENLQTAWLPLAPRALAGGVGGGGGEGEDRA